MSDVELVPQKHGGALRKGNPGSRTTPQKRVRQMLQDALIRPDGSGIVSALIKEAQHGDVAAQKLCLEYGIGRPTERLEVTGEGGGPVLLSPVLAALSDERIDEELKKLEG